MQNLHTGNKTMSCIDRSLSESVSGDLAEVRLVILQLVKSRCWHLNLEIGDVLQCISNEDEGVTVARRDGSRITIPHDYAHFIGVRDVPQPFDETPADEQSP